MVFPVEYVLCAQVVLMAVGGECVSNVQSIYACSEGGVKQDDNGSVLVYIFAKDP